MNFFGHLSCLVKEIRKIPAGNQKCSKMRCFITVTKRPWSQVLGHSSHWIPGTLSWTLVCKDFSGLFQSAWTPGATQGGSAHEAFNKTQTVGHAKVSETSSAGWSSNYWRLSWQLWTFDQWFPFPSTRLAAVPLASYHDPWLTSSCLVATDSQLIPRISKWRPGSVAQEKRESPQCNQDYLRYFQGLGQNENVGFLFKRQEKC